MRAEAESKQVLTAERLSGKTVLLLGGVCDGVDYPSCGRNLATSCCEPRSTRSFRQPGLIVVADQAATSAGADGSVKSIRGQPSERSIALARA